MSRRILRRKAFTLVELLVVIGIIALLVAILMPALSKARDQANSVKCMSNMRQIGQAYLMHAAEHRNHVPTAGLIHSPYYAAPAGLGDVARNKYIYYSESGTERPLPIPAALGIYMGQKITATSAQELKQQMDSGPIREVFTCPTQSPDTMQEGVMLRDQPGWEAPRFRSSYIFNEEPLGFNDQGLPAYARGKGNLNRMRGTSDTVMLMDGKVRNYFPWLVIFGLANNRTLENVFYGQAAGDPSNFDFERHKGKINMVFMDGHAETVSCTVKPNFQTPVQVTFGRKVYTVPENGF